MGQWEGWRARVNRRLLGVECTTYEHATARATAVANGWSVLGPSDSRPNALGQHGPLRAATLLPFPLSFPGGISTFVGELLEELQKNPDLRVQLIGSRRFSAAPGRPLAKAWVALTHFLLLLQIKADVVHTHEHPALLAAALTYAAVASQPVRVVHTVHVHPPKRRSLWKRAMLGWMFARCDVVTVVSAATADRLDHVSLPVPEHVKVIRGAARVRLPDPGDPAVAAFRSSLALGDGPVVSQIAPLTLSNKVAGVEVLLEAVAIVRRRVPGLRLVLVGGGPLLGQVQQRAAHLGVADCTTFTDSLDDVSVPLALTDVYCQITGQDACPLSLLEAMYAGKPVIASRTGGIPEIITHGVDGLLVSNTPHQIAEALLELLEARDRAAAVGIQAAVTARARFTWERVAGEFAETYGLTPQGRNLGRLAPVRGVGAPLSRARWLPARDRVGR